MSEPKDIFLLRLNPQLTNYEKSLYLFEGGDIMKKLCLLLVIVILITVTSITGNTEIKLLQIKQPDISKGKYRLLVNLNHIEAIISEYGIEGITANIDFADSTDLVQARFGKITNGTIKWIHKIEDDNFLLIKFHKKYYKTIAQKINDKEIHTGYQIILSNPKTNVVLKSYKITFADFADLAIELKYPVKVEPGQKLQHDISITIENKGAAAAREFNIDFVLSKDNHVPVKMASYSKNFQEDALLENGREKISELKPTEKNTLQLKNALTIPSDILPGKYNFCAIIDSGNTIKELNENNNIFIGFIIIDIKEPKRITLDLTDTKLVYNPLDYGLTIVSHGIILSDGKDWRKCRMRPYLYQIMHVGWKNLHWEINTVDRGVWEIRGAQFCKSGGSDKELKIKMNIKGGSKLSLPSRFTLFLPKTKIDYEPAIRKLSGISFGKQIVYIPFWKVCKVGTNLYHFKYAMWKNFFLEVNIQEKAVYRVTNGNFCRAGGTQEPLGIKVLVEY